MQEKSKEKKRKRKKKKKIKTHILQHWLFFFFEYTFLSSKKDPSDMSITKGMKRGKGIQPLSARMSTTMLIMPTNISVAIRMMTRVGG